MSYSVIATTCVCRRAGHGNLALEVSIKSPKGFPFAHQIGSTWSTAYFESIDSTHTRVVARMLGYTSDPESQTMRAFFVTGNKATMDSLVKRFRRE